MESLERRDESLERKLERKGSRVHSQYQHEHSEYGWAYFSSYVCEVHWNEVCSFDSGSLSSWLRNFLVSASV
jgi:hypothetical protein